jgi:riboflavin kinase/FMN adenylyltransferase
MERWSCGACMDVIDDLSRAALRQDTILTIGAFDGVHRGHQALIRQVVARARASERVAALITFHPHPGVVLAPGRAPLYLSTPGEKLALLEALDVDLVAMLPFSRELAAMPARQFMQAVTRHLRPRELWVGPDFALGRSRAGNVPELQLLGAELGFSVHVVEPVADLEEGRALISSSRIRALLGEGRVEEAAQMLGRYPTLSGEVVGGARRGRGLGFPTANLEVRPEQAVPADGVYAVFVLLGEERYPAVANVGVRPSFDNGQRTVETHILDFEEDIYGCDLVVQFVARLRSELRFEKVPDLVAQIEQDSRTARSLLSQRAQGRPVFLASLSRSATRLPPLPLPSIKGRMGPSEEQTPCLYRYEEIEHTADRALRVWGARLSGLFVGAARGMYRLMGEPGAIAASHWREIELQAMDRETLLVGWLNELLFLTESEGLLFSDFSVKSLTDTALAARAGGAPGEVTGAHIKAATFHSLEVVENGTGFSAVITFDV